MAYSLSQTTQQSGLQYSPSISGGGSSVASPTVQINPTPVDSFANDIDALLGSTLKASKAYFDLSDDATKMIAVDHLVRYKEGSTQIDGDTSLTPEQKKVKLGELNASLNGEVADKIMNNDRAREIYDSTYSNHARLLYANSMANLDNEIHKRDVNIMKENISSMTEANVPLSEIFEHPNAKTLLAQGKLTRKDIVDTYLKGIKKSVENDYDQVALNGGDLVKDRFMTKNKNGVYEYDANKLKQYTANKLSGSITLKDGVFVVDERFGTPEEIKSYTNSINSFMSNYAEKANRINQVEQNEYEAKVKEATREANAIKREEQRWNALYKTNIADNVKTNALELKNIDNVSIEKLVNNAKEFSDANDQTNYKKTVEAIDAIRANTSVKKDMDIYLDKLLTGQGNPSDVSMLKGYVNGGYTYNGEMGAIKVDSTAIKNNITDKLNGRLEYEASQIDINKPETIDNYMQVAQRIRAAGTSLEVKVSAFDVSDKFVSDGLIDTVNDPKDLLKLAYTAKAKARETTSDTSYIDKMIGSLSTSYATGVKKGLSPKEISVKMMQDTTGVVANQKMKLLRTEREVITNNLNNWIDTTMPDSSSSLFAGILAKQGGSEVTTEAIDKAKDEGTIMDTRGNLKSVFASTFFSHNTNTIVTPTLRGERQTPSVIMDGLDSYFIKNKLDKYDYEIGNYTDSNGDIAIMLTRYSDSTDKIFLKNDDILKGFLPKKGNK